MKKNNGFSLAEALITLLIVAIIAMVSVPVITKKKKSPRSAAEILWNADLENPTISPASSRDIKLGKTSGLRTQGIVVVDRLEFKNRNNEVMGWIDEDGTSSFSNTDEIMRRQNEILKMLENLSNNINGAINASPDGFNFSGSNTNRNSNSGLNGGITGRERLERKQGKANGGITGRDRLMRNGTGRERLNRKSSNDRNDTITPEQMEQIAELQKQLQTALQNRN